MKGLRQNIYRSIFWIGYLLVFLVAIIPIKNDLHYITINVISFKFHFDQILHALVYFLVIMYLPVGQYFGINLFDDNSLLKFFVIVVILGTITEIVQLFVPDRTFNIFDLVANLIGIGIGLFVIKLTNLIKHRNSIN